MEINPVLEVYKANQNNTVMPFQIYKNISNSNKRARTLQKKGTSKARQRYHRWQQRCHYTFKCQDETLNQKERTSWISSIGFTPNGLIMDCAFKGWNESQKYITPLKRKLYKPCYHGVFFFFFTLSALPKFLSKLYKTKYHFWQLWNYGNTSSHPGLFKSHSRIISASTDTVTTTFFWTGPTLKRLINSIKSFEKFLFDLDEDKNRLRFTLSTNREGLVISTRKRANVNTLIFSKQIS